ncbi:MAG: glycosyltransferase [Ornithinimicrobium sp.]
MSPSDPQWSVVVPSYNRPDELRRCVTALQSLRAGEGESVEILIVDDGGARAAEPVAMSVPGPHQVRVYRQVNQGPAAARNAGAAHARGRWLALTDDDCRPRGDWLIGLGAALHEHPAALVGGRTVNALADNAWSEATQILVDHVVSTTPGGFLPSCNLAVDRQRFLASGGFDVSFPRAAGEDRALCDAWLAAGGKVLLVEGAVVDHEHRLTPRSFWRQHAGYGRAAHRIHATTHGSQPGPPSRYLSLLTGPFARLPVLPALNLSSRLLISQLATAWGWFRAYAGRGA